MICDDNGVSQKNEYVDVRFLWSKQPVSGGDGPNDVSSSSPPQMDVRDCTSSSSDAPSGTAAVQTKKSHDEGNYQSRQDSGKEERKRQRTTFTQSQLRILEEAFARQQYLVGSERLRLAALLNIGVAQVKVWFQNRRIRWRREQRQLLLNQTLLQSTPAMSSGETTSSNEIVTSSTSAFTDRKA